MSRIAVLSDIHGNRWALEAVLGDMDRLGVAKAVNLGDLFYGPLDPSGTVELFADRAFPTVLGNEDRILTEESAPPSPTLAFVRSRLAGGTLAWLRSLGSREVFGDVLLFHGSPWGWGHILRFSIYRRIVLSVNSGNAILNSLIGAVDGVAYCAPDLEGHRWNSGAPDQTAVRERSCDPDNAARTAERPAKSRRLDGPQPARRGVSSPRSISRGRGYSSSRRPAGPSRSPTPT